MAGEKGLTILKRSETFIYQVAYYMLQDESLALQAAKRTIKTAFANDTWLQMDEQAQAEYMRKLTIRTSLEIHFRHASAAELVSS